EVSGYCVDEPLSPLIFSADLIVLATESILKILPKGILEKVNGEIILARRAIDFRNIYKLLDIPPKTKAMLFNDRKETAEEVISLLYGMGFEHVWLIPVYPDHPNPPRVELAITPGEAALVPPGVREVIDIGTRVLDLSTLIEILIKCDLLDEKANMLSARYMSNMIDISRRLAESLSENENNNKLLNAIIQKINNGVIATDINGNIMICNNTAEKIINLSRDKILGANADDVLPSLGINRPLNTGKAENEVPEHINNHNILVNRIPLENNNVINGALFTFYEFSEVEKIENKLRGHLYAKGHVAKYSFHNILGTSSVLKKQIKNAEKFALLDSTVVIQGESGTGKELMAHAIHNVSPRRKKPFVAINCAALPRDLLESELFGFEEGTFTGARKGGKVGLFEQAHLGTIFLDEIGEIPLETQVKLLRVLEAKEVMRIGSDRILPIDVRVIAATNRNLKKLVEEKRFREDLYFRLNVLKVFMPPLRERKEDICLLADFILAEFGKSVKEFLSKEMINWLEDYSWPGNVRELRNIMEFLIATVPERKAYIDDLPVDYLEVNEFCEKPDSDKPIQDSSLIVNDNLPLNINGMTLLEEDVIILKLLSDYGECGMNLGRRKLKELVAHKGLFLSEDKIRSRLKVLEQKKLVSIFIGRKGSEITKHGKELLEMLEKTS
ncbi:MAG: sigma-54 interaction domain-containing protein, partial [Peptococcales bacterium]